MEDILQQGGQITLTALGSLAALFLLTKLSGNDVYAMTFKAFHGPLRGLTAEHYRSAAERKQSVKLHAELAESVKAGDGERAAGLVKEIIMRADENLSGKRKRG